MATKGVNKVILVGNLGNDPEVRYMPNGNAVANLSLATSESWKDQQGQVQERTEWHRLTMYRRLAEIAGEYLKKKVHKFTLKVNFKRANGKISRAKTGTPLKSLSIRCKCSAVAITMVAATKAITKIKVVTTRTKAAIMAVATKVAVIKIKAVRTLVRTHLWQNQILTLMTIFLFSEG